MKSLVEQGGVLQQETHVVRRAWSGTHRCARAINAVDLGTRLD
ncbi:MAG: hypothetical protein M0004_08980 [Actinomycetota bacterium]|nr:hypothetical protein [Actinomycetota bacterium]